MKYTSIFDRSQAGGEQEVIIVKNSLKGILLDGPLKEELFGVEYSAILKYYTNYSSELLSNSMKGAVRPMLVGN